MRGPLGNPDFTVSVFTAVIVTSAFAFFLDAPSPLVVVMLVLGLFTALVEHRVHSPPPPATMMNAPRSNRNSPTWTWPEKMNGSIFG